MSGFIPNKHHLREVLLHWKSTAEIYHLLEKVLRTLWLGRLTAQMQTMLTTRGDDDHHSVADQADRIAKRDRKQNSVHGNRGTTTDEGIGSQRSCGKTAEASSSIKDTGRKDG
ncbi:hypothetical protein ALC56_14530 [Trachymyrmex septentrionalis]|uniref:Uncharacterized protein n=1 Tax=Trachymyrmex septentrionalis TaxID=34720 RepID=A0A195ESE0_9HYME|nr:hypothetical protein ALC56_14530 [Trachymyrmex septentrionalis]